MAEANSAEMEKDPDLAMGDLVGKAGLELELEKRLRGHKGLYQMEVDAHGRMLPKRLGAAPSPGRGPAVCPARAPPLPPGAAVPGTAAILCDTDGHIRGCSCNTISECIHTGGSVDTSIIDTTLSEGQHFFEATLPGLYDESHFIEGVAVSNINGENIGVVLMIAPSDQIQGVLTNTTAIFFYVCVVVLAAAIVGSYLLSRNYASGLSALTKAATRFRRLGQGAQAAGVVAAVAA